MFYINIPQPKAFRSWRRYQLRPFLTVSVTLGPRSVSRPAALTTYKQETLPVACSAREREWILPYFWDTWLLIKPTQFYLYIKGEKTSRLQNLCEYTLYSSVRNYGKRNISLPLGDLLTKLSLKYNNEASTCCMVWIKYAKQNCNQLANKREVFNFSYVSDFSLGFTTLYCSRHHPRHFKTLLWRENWREHCFYICAIKYLGLDSWANSLPLMVRLVNG